MNPYKSLYYKFQIRSFICNRRLEYNYNTKPKCYIFLAADYGNLGDIAITLAQKKFLKQHFRNYNVVEIHAAQTLNALNVIKKHISGEDIVTVVGGGNMGDMYGDIELLRLMVVEAFPHNRIILFPQTIDYSNSKDAEWLLRKSCKVYGSHPRLTMCAREEFSAKKMHEYYPAVDIRLTPDIVMGLEHELEAKREDLVTFCLRQDKEKTDNHKLISLIKGRCRDIGLVSDSYDTHIGDGRFDEQTKYAELEKILQQFSRSRLVVTDRLHGMIFSFITRTPAIVLPNSNFKIKGCFKWIEECGYIGFISSASDLKQIDSIFHSSTDNSEIQSKIKKGLTQII